MSISGGSTAEPDQSIDPEVSAGTARFIARSLLIASHERRYVALLPADSAGLQREFLLATGDHWFVRAANSRVFRAVCRGAAAVTLPGIILHYIVRERCLEQWVRGICVAGQARPGGSVQLVVLGAGLDTLGWRLHRQAAELTVIEMDRPAALRVKATAMTGKWARQQNLTSWRRISVRRA